MRKRPALENRALSGEGETASPDENATAQAHGVLPRFVAAGPGSRERFAPLLASLASGALAAILLLTPSGAGGQQIPDQVSADALRVCADPANMPYSSTAGEGFENKIAEIVADELKVPVRYYFMPQGPGFVRNTLGKRLCDVVIGYAAGADPVLHTNPYYQSVYVLLVKAGGPLDGVEQLSDPRLKGKRLGVMAATPPADRLLEYGLLPTSRTYSLLVDRRFDSPAEQMIDDLAKGEIDGALLWGPTAGAFAAKAAVPLKTVPLLKEGERPSMTYRITMGVRQTDHDWKQVLNRVLRKRAADIDKVLLAYHVPLLDDDDQLVTGSSPDAGRRP
ncbi:quinoprotein dehydrogenase-associated putative ABC transporter substrate-binding protein [Xanthobacter dioxanivorans]|uniref:Quinoprotein dehydrogenase-associated putative ABC transporter substrate-binding protein n=1 Tax=Xanthobacter dioxanivorans TaxID=2528964 RepID=A0A974SL37_9HYPH|nr:quinoprotein dehydrogenase-associated putative ABC transporter substrate-binding protein [Xanthobacter dioxanivorans]